MNYNEVLVKVTPFTETNTDILAAMLGEIGYESFVVENDQMKAYVGDK
ncbi:MAG: 50S ribosomal protein L11 methyltransferase, partial [Bacteroidales bacterium]